MGVAEWARQRMRERPARAALSAIMLVAGTFPAGAAAAPASILWRAGWIAAQPDPLANDTPENAAEKVRSASRPLPIFRRPFQIGKAVAQATLSISGLGQFEAHINGQNVTTAVLTPGWSDYRKRVFYDTYDVTTLLKPGENVIGVMLGNGMYNVQQTNGRYTKFAGTFGPAQADLPTDDPLGRRKQADHGQRQ